MRIITLTSDMGLSDHYVAAVKAAILSAAPEVNIVDISHQVHTFDLNEAAFIIRSVWKDFPVGTVHVIGINPEYRADQTHYIVHYMGHYFVAANNGIFALLFDEVPEDIFEITLEQGDDWTFPMKGVFASVAAHLSKGGNIEFIAKRVAGYKTLINPNPIVDEDSITGRIVHIDKYGNVYCNITRSIFESVKRGRRYSIQLKRPKDSIKAISHNFSDVKLAERMAMWATNGYLLIAIKDAATDHGGGTAGLLNLNKGDSIKIQFDGNPNSEDDF